MVRPEGFEPTTRGLRIRCKLPESLSPSKTCDNGENVLASCLAFLSEKMPDLACVIEAWDGLPEAVRAGILAMVKAVK